MKWLLLLFALYFTREGYASPEENEQDPDTNLFEGDIILDPIHRMEIELGMPIGSLEASHARGAFKSRRWPNGQIPYTFDDSLAHEERARTAIQKAMNEWNTKTHGCITFKERTTEKGYVTFRTGTGCSSSIGHTGKQQFINLHRNCWSRGTVVHEMGHALGLFHEQSRPDRDDYVKINWENIVKGKQFNFKKYDNKYINSLGEPYDYGSIMHYGKKYFTKDRSLNTIEPLQEGVSIGQRQALSELDARQVRKMYQCL